jgi:streptomycin 6-kinase
LLISDEHRASVIAMRGDQGAAWLATLPDVLQLVAARWQLRLGPTAGRLWFNYVAHAELADGTPAVLKLCLPDEPEFSTEAASLQRFDGHGCARLLKLDAERGALLLEALQPGTPLLTVAAEVTRLEVSCDVMPRLWRPVEEAHPFPTVAYWASGIQRLLRDHFEGTTGPLPEALVARAESVFAELLASEQEQVLLHGDLHWANILAAQRSPWLAIDPKGIVGERAFEAAILLHTDLPAENVALAIRLRRDMLCERLGFDRQRLQAWSFARAVLSAVWSVDDNQDPRAALEAAESLQDL